VPNSGPTVASRTAMIVGKLVERASLQLLDDLREHEHLPADHTPRSSSQQQRAIAPSTALLRLRAL
jgi:hypothetical protein